MTPTPAATVEQKLLSNIPKILLFNGGWMFLIIMPVMVPFLQSSDLDMEQIYILQTVFAISVVVLEVPSGYIADLLGRKQTILTGSLFNIAGFTILAFSETFAGFVLFELFVAIAASLISGTDVALIYDSIHNLKVKKFSETEILGKKIFYSQSGETVAALLGGALAAYSLTLPAKVNAITCWIPFLIALTFYEPERKRMDTRRHLENFHYIYVSLFRHSKLLTLIILNLIVYGIATLIAVWAFQGYWKELGIPLSYFGYLWAAYNLSVALSARIAHKLERKFGAVALITIVTLLPVVGYWGMAFFFSMVGVLFGFAFQLSRGIGQVLLRDALNARVSGDMRATANSIASLGVRLTFAFLGPLMGFLIDHRGYSTAFYSFGGLFVLAFFLFSLPLISQRKYFR